MRKVLLAFFSGAVGIVCGGSAHAACGLDFDVAATKAMKFSMVRAFQPCPGSPYPSFPNAETEGDTDACSPVFPRETAGDSTPYSFGPSGSCSIKLSSKIQQDCSTLTNSEGVPLGLLAEPCHLTTVTGKCKDILDEGLLPIGATDAGWKLRMLVRTSIDYEPNSMTVVDFQMLFDFDAPNGGSIKIKGTTAEAVQESLNDVLPACTSMELNRIEILDPDGFVFARPGGSTSPN